MSKFSCDTVRDMLPLYVDNIVSDDTKAIVEEHLACSIRHHDSV